MSKIAAILHSLTAPSAAVAACRLLKGHVFLANDHFHYPLVLRVPTSLNSPPANLRCRRISSAALGFSGGSYMGSILRDSGAAAGVMAGAYVLVVTFDILTKTKQIEQVFLAFAFSMTKSSYGTLQ